MEPQTCFFSNFPSLPLNFLLLVHDTTLRKRREGILKLKGAMDLRVGFGFLMVLFGNWACEARLLAKLDILDSHRIEKKVDVCTKCEEYASFAINYLTENSTRTEIIEVLRDACSDLHPLKKQCITLVDHYAPLFFTQLSLVQPDEICEKANLCQDESNLVLPLKENSCDVCHHAVDEIILMLHDPDRKLEIIEILLKGCNALEKYAKMCKALVFEYGPLILTNVEKYLEKTDVCSTIHACKKMPSALTKESLFDEKIMMVTLS
ncbi:hypothetical protein V2J09_010738 [Rumex salicifolius]